MKSKLTTAMHAGGNMVTGIAGAVSKTMIEPGYAPMPAKKGPSGGLAGGAKVDRRLTASDMSGNCGKLAVGPCMPKA